MIYCPQCATRLEQRHFDGRQRPSCPTCSFIAFADPKVAATVIVERDGAVLFVRRNIDPGRGLWCFPGGFVDFGENPRAAAARECVEEAGLHVEDLRLLDVAFNGKVIVISYATRTFSPADPVPADDADAAEWFRPADFPPLAFESTMLPALEAWQRGSR